MVDGAEDWDSYGRVIASEYPFLAQRDSNDYEPFNDLHPFVQTDYDVMDRPIKQTNADGSKKLLQYHFGRDDKGALRFRTTIIDENGISSAMLKSPQDWTIQQIAGDGSHTLFEYSPIGELLRTTDADGYQTTYTYDLLGRMIRRVHPDAGTTNLQYDLAGNLIAKQTANLALANAAIQYIYKFSRLKEIRYPFHPENNVTYSYDAAGRVAVRQDGTGSEEFLYDKLGNLAQSLRRIVIPTENNAYMFLTRFTYDSFGRMRSIRYPDGEMVKYAYTTGGLLKSVIGQKQNRQHVYLQNRRYDEQGRKTFQLNGNGVCTRYTYDAHRQWMNTLQTEVPDDNIIQDIQYEYDKVGNITDIHQLASDVGLGGAYTNTYMYDKQYRLTESNGVGKYPYSFEASYSPSGRLGMKNTSTDQWRSNLLYGYNKSTLPLLTHQPRTVYDSGNGTMNHFWDANGNLAQIVDCKHNAARVHEWDEENRLTFVLRNRYAGYYGYDANGERVYKLVGTTSLNQLNGGYMDANVLFDACVLYPNPYIVVTKTGYTKHYYAGTERLATVIGGGGLGDIGNPINHLSSQHDLDIVSSFHSRYSDSDPFEHANNVSEPVGTVGIDGISHSELDYTCSPIILTNLDVLTHHNILLEAIEQNAPTMTLEQNVYFFHGDHLGSANWITDGGGNPIQYIHYAPYGEQIANQQTIGYDERFKFTGKERDWETGYDYFGARFYDSRKGFWNSVDPLADKYPGNTPYLYCGGNPIMLVDPDGRSTKDVIIGYSLGILTSLIPGTSFLRDTYTPNSSVDYNTALATVDKVSLIVGSEMAIAGASGVGAGSAIVVSGGAAASTIIGAPEGAAIAVGGVAVITGSEALAAGGTMIMANAVSNKAQGYNRGSSKTSTSSAPKSINQLNQDVKRGKAPKGITDFHTGKVVGEQEHVHFKDGSALNKDGTWKHGDGKKSLTIEQAQYLKQNGWNIEY